MRYFALVLLLASVSARAQQYDEPPGTGTYHGCTDPVEEGLDVARSVLGQWDSQYYDFRPLGDYVALGSDAPPEVHAVCDVIREEAPPQDDWQMLNFFDAGTHYVVVTHPYDPDPTDNEISTGMRTVGVYDRDGRYVAAVSF